LLLITFYHFFHIFLNNYENLTGCKYLNTMYIYLLLIFCRLGCIPFDIINTSNLIDQSERKRQRCVYSESFRKYTNAMYWNTIVKHVAEKRLRGVIAFVFRWSLKAMLPLWTLNRGHELQSHVQECSQRVTYMSSLW